MLFSFFAHSELEKFTLLLVPEIPTLIVRAGTTHPWRSPFDSNASTQSASS